MRRPTPSQDREAHSDHPYPLVKWRSVDSITLHVVRSGTKPGTPLIVTDGKL